MLEALSLTEQNAVSAETSVQTFPGKVVLIQMQKEGHRYDISSASEETFHLIHHEAFYNDVDIYYTHLRQHYQAIYVKHVKPRAVQIKKHT